MNILIPHSWLLEHLDTDATPQEIQKYLSLCGPSIERIYQKEGDAVYDIEVTTNRVDSMSVRGIAREAAVILKQFGKRAKLKKLELEMPKFEKRAPVQLMLPTILNDENLCKRILCVALASVGRRPTPEWMAKRLRQIDVNVHDAVIDITNYVTHDLGHPCHAFDYDRIMELGGTIIIKTATKGKKFMTLDGAEYTTVGGEVVFENDQGEIIDLPGIKGTANTSINSETSRVLFWIESIEAQKIRFASMTHAIRTVAAQINEKNVDPNLAMPVLEEGVELFQMLAHAKVASKVYDEFPGRKKPATVKVPLRKITEYLGVELPLNKIAKILEDLECEVELRAAGKKTEPTLLITPPTFRPDITIPVDVIEEIARIYGYHNLPSVIMSTAIPTNTPKEFNFHIENRTKRFLADIGWQELYTYSMVSEELAKQSGFSIDEHLKIANPLSDDRVYMRQSLLPSLEEVIANNPQRKMLSVFEIANVYHPVKNSLPNEVLQLAMVSTRDYRQAKGDFEALLAAFFVKDFTIKIQEKAVAPFAQSAEILVGGEKIGNIGVLPTGHTAIQIIFREFLNVIHTHPEYQPAAKTSEIAEDLTFTLPEKTLVGEVIDELKQSSVHIKDITVKDVYGQNMTFAITYNDPSNNLTVENVGPLRKKLVALVETKWHGKLIGSLQ